MKIQNFKSTLAALFLTFSVHLNGTPRYFIFAEADQPWERGGTYVVPLSDSDLIEQAELLLSAYRENGLDGIEALQTQAILVARIMVGADGINRNFALPNAPAWNWHVSAPSYFAEVVPEALQGLPKFVEDDAVRLLSDGIAGGYFREDGTGGIALNCFPVGEFPFPFDPADGLEWKFSWIGWFNDTSFPWIFHERLGWHYVPGFDPSSVWMWSSTKVGWIWTTETVFPWFYDSAQSSWRWFSAASEDTIWIYHAKKGVWENSY